MTTDEAKACLLKSKNLMERTLTESYGIDECEIEQIIFIIGSDGIPGTLIVFDDSKFILMRKGYGQYG